MREIIIYMANVIINYYIIITDNDYYHQDTSSCQKVITEYFDNQFHKY